jgi:hypothetical protein
MSLTFPRSPIAKFWLNNQWVSVSNDIRQTDPISITYGQKDGAAKPTPAKCTFTLDDGTAHGNGNYDPNNPMGTYFDYLSRSTPMLLNLAYGNDQFGRVSASGLGTSTDFGAYATFQSAGTVASDITSGQARHSVTSTAAFIASYLPSVSIKNVDLYIEAGLDTALNVAGGNIEIGNLLLRGQSISTYYMLRVDINFTTEQIQMKLMMGSSQDLTGTVLCGTFWDTTDPMSIRFQADGNTFRGKVWRTSTTEPFEWNLEYSHGDVFGAGWFGVRTGVATGNSNAKPINVLYDNFRVEIPRFAGNIVSMEPDSNETHTDRTVQVEAAGVLRRLQKSKKILDTPARRYHTQFAQYFLADYYPLDEDVDQTTRGQSPITGRIAQFAQTTGGANLGATKFGQSANRISMDKTLELSSGGILALNFDNPGFYSASFAVTWTQKQPVDASTALYMFLTNADFLQWTQTAGGQVSLTYFGATGSTIIYSAFLPPTFTGDDNQWYNCGLSVHRNSGSGDTDFILNYSTPQSYYTILRTIHVLVTGEPQQFAFIANDSDSKNKLQVAHVGVWANDFDDVVLAGIALLDVQTGGSFNGWPGETAGQRFVRLVGEESLSYGLIGYETVSQTMGGQGRNTLYQLLLDCATASQGILMEARGNAAVVLRNNRSMLSQNATLTLSYSNQELVKPFKPVTDDQGIVNDVTAKRPFGAEYEYEKTTGPLNISEPTDDFEGVGRYDVDFTTNVQTDSQLSDQAAWRVAVGTADGPRFTNLSVNLRADSLVNTNKPIQALDVGVGDLITVQNAQLRRIYDDINLIVWGYTEKFNTQYEHTITYNTAPGDVYKQFTLDSSSLGRIDSSSSVLNEDLTTTEPDIDIAFTEAGDQWSTTVGDFPFDVLIGGERVTLTANSGSTSPQTATGTRSVNSVVKTQATGAKVRLFRPSRLTLD